MKLIVSLLVLSSAAHAQSTISGSVHDDSGAVVAGAFVQATRVREVVRDILGHLVSQGRYVSAAAQVAADGTFRLTGIPSGKYYICAYVSVPGYLSNCEWKAPVPTSTIAVNVQVSNVAPTLVKGTIVGITVADPQGLINPALVTALGNPPKHTFYPGVSTSQGYYSPARFSGNNGTSHSYVVTIPKTTTVFLFVDTDLTATTSTGQSVPSRVRSDISIAGGPSAIAINLVVQ